MKNKLISMKKLILSIVTIILFFLFVSCNPKNSEQTFEGNGKNTNNEVSPEGTSGTDGPDVTEVTKQTAFDKDIKYLTEKGIILPDLSQDEPVTTETLLSLLAKTHEAIGGEIDITKVNPRNNLSDAVKKMILMGVYENYQFEDKIVDSNVSYATTAYWFLKLQDSVQKRFYARSDVTTTTGDLLRRINVSNSLYTWLKDAQEVKIYTLRDLIQEEITLDEPLTRLLAAEMLVTAYEEIHGEITRAENLKFSDTDSIYALKSNQLFFWPESDLFEPDTLSRWNDQSFSSAIIYDSQIRLSLDIEEANVPYGAVTSAMATFIRGYEDVKQHRIEEVIVLNERPYDWYVNQNETGEYSINNCMPSCIEMAIRYQGLTKIPSAEQLRAENLMDGLGWHDVLAENVMKQYGLQFTDSFEIKLQTMLDYLNQGNVLYVMYRDPIAEYGHAVILKGYWKQGDSVDFIVADPNSNTYGPFGYLETLMDAESMISQMESHVPRYFIIPAGE